MPTSAFVCSNPEVLAAATRVEADSPNQAHDLPYGCTVFVGEYRVAVVRMFEVDGIGIAEIEYGDEQKSKAFTRLIRNPVAAVRQGHVREAPVKTARAGNTVGTGGWLCETHYQAAANVRVMAAGGMVGFRGCDQVGAEIPVNIIERSEFNGIEVVKVGNAGGVAWVAASDLK